MADFSVDVHNGGVAVDSAVVVKGLDNVKSDTTVHSDSKVTADGKLTSNSVVKADSTATVGVDLQPVAVDTCLRIELAPPPPTVLRTPWTSTFGLSWLGVELVALTFSGELRNYVEPAPKTPQVLGTIEQAPGLTVRIDP
jgi:hypothetical protein